MKNVRSLQSHRKPRRALSIVEMMVAVSVFAAVGIFVSFLTIEIARMARTSLDMIPSELQAYRTLDRIRSELLPASARNVVIDPDGITFTNPARDSGVTGISPVPPARMRIWLENDGTCLFNPDLNNPNSAAIAIGNGIEDLRFEAAGDRRIRISVATAALVSTVTAEQDRMTTYTDVITVRN